MNNQQDRITLAFKVSEKMIIDIEEKIQESIQSENWNRAADLKSYLNGMQQMLIVFEQALDRNNK